MEPAGAPAKWRRRLCWCSKDDFFPEESFQSWGHYVKALAGTRARLRDRVAARSTDRSELTEVRARSGHDMRKDLSWWDLMWFGVGGIIGAGIFVLTGLEARTDAGPAVVLSYAISGLAAMLSVFCYTEFAIEIPVAGGSFAYLRVELGDFVAFIAAGNILFEYIVSGAAVARSWSSYLATLFNQKPDFFRIVAPRLAEDYNHLDPMAVLVIVAVSALAIVGTKSSSRFNSITTLLHLLIISFIVIAGLSQADAANYRPFAPFGARGLFKASAVLFFAYVGFDAVSTMAEETKNPGRDIPIGLVGSMSITTVIYCILAVTLSLMQPYTQVDEHAPFSVAFQAVGLGWAKYIVALGALKGMTTVLLVAAVGQARYLTHIARTHMVPPWLAEVNARSGTPINATVVMGTATAVFAFFTKLSILANLLSISTLFIFSLVALAVLVRRYYVSGETSDSERNKLIGFLAMIAVSSVVTAVYRGVSEGGWAMYALAVPIWFAATMGMKLFVKEARRPKLWGVPLVPWLPSASIAVNVFLLGSIDGQSYIRFGIWTIGLLVYYLLCGLHASFDTARAGDTTETNAAPSLKNAEEGSVSTVETSNSKTENTEEIREETDVEETNVSNAAVRKTNQLDRCFSM